MSQIRLLNEENVARAIFLPEMMEDGGVISYSAFTLRHNESYFSVARMAVDSWLEDIKRIPQNDTRILGGYCRMNVGTIRAIDFRNDGDTLTFDVEDKSSQKNLSHAGIVVTFGGGQLRGDKHLVLKPIPANISASRLLMRIQSRLAKIASMDFVAL